MIDAPAGKGSSRICGPEFLPTPHYTFKRLAFIPIMSTPLEFDEKKFWITLFSIMAKREAANANAITASFVPFISSHGERYTSKRISEKDESRTASSFCEL
jgi:hypothetical protein